MCTSTITNSAMARGRLMSALGDANHSYLEPMPSASNRLHTKMKTNRAMARGTTAAPRGPMEPSTCLETASTATSQAACKRPGTPLGQAEQDHHDQRGAGRPDCVHVQREPGDLLLDVLADGDLGRRKEGRARHDAHGHQPSALSPGTFTLPLPPEPAPRTPWPATAPMRNMERATLKSRSTWNTARPPRMPTPRSKSRNMRPRATTDTPANLATVLVARGRRVPPLARRPTLATDRCAIRKLTSPSPRPTHSPSPVSEAPSATQSTSPATPTTSEPRTVRRDTRATSGRENRSNITPPSKQGCCRGIGQQPGCCPWPGPEPDRQRRSEELADLGHREQHRRHDPERQACEAQGRRGAEPRVEPETDGTSTDHADRARHADPEEVGKGRWPGALRRLWPSVRAVAHRAEAVPRQTGRGDGGSSEYPEVTRRRLGPRRPSGWEQPPVGRGGDGTQGPSSHPARSHGKTRAARPLLAGHAHPSAGGGPAAALLATA